MSREKCMHKSFYAKENHVCVWVRKMCVWVNEGGKGELVVPMQCSRVTSLPLSFHCPLLCDLYDLHQLCPPVCQSQLVNWSAQRRNFDVFREEDDGWGVTTIYAYLNMRWHSPTITQTLEIFLSSWVLQARKCFKISCREELYVNPFLLSFSWQCPLSLVVQKIIIIK